MRTVNVSTKEKTINSLLKKAQRGGLILRSPGGQEFILAEINDFNREIELTRQNKALMKLLDSRGKQTKTLQSVLSVKAIGVIRNAAPYSPRSVDEGLVVFRHARH